jgi:predicted nuclease of predicted toxin-antitoxin system
MKILIDMNLSPEWVEVIERHGWKALHWSTVGEKIHC